MAEWRPVAVDPDGIHGVCSIKVEGATLYRILTVVWDLDASGADAQRTLMNTVAVPDPPARDAAQYASSARRRTVSELAAVG